MAHLSAMTGAVRLLLAFVLSVLTTTAESFVEMPKFNQLELLYPGYHLQGGEYRNREIPDLIGGNHTNPVRHLRNTSPLRMSIALNKYGGRHAIGTEPVVTPSEGIVSITGKEGQQYIFQNTAFGPFLAGKYGNPLLVKPNKHKRSLTMQPIIGKQGIVHLVSYHEDHPGGHIGLWNCDSFFSSPDWSSEHHLISVEFWETPDSYCPPKPKEPSFLELLLHKFRLVPLSTVPPSSDRSHQLDETSRTNINSLMPHIDGTTVHKVRHGHKTKKFHRLKEILQRP